MDPLLHFHVYASPLSSIPKRIFGGLVVADLLGDLFKHGSGDSTIFAPINQSTNPTISIDWANTPQLVGLANIGFVQFLGSGASSGEVVLGAGDRTAGARAGVFILPRFAPLDSRIGDNAEDIDGPNTAIHWTPVAGDWQTVTAKAGVGVRGLAIFNKGSSVTDIAETAGTIPKNRCLAVDVEMYGKDPAGPQAGFRFEWGGMWSFVLRSGCKPTIEKKVVSPSGAVQQQKVMTLNGFSTSNLTNGKYLAYIMRLDGKLVFILEGKSGGAVSVWLLDNLASPDGKVLPDVSWPESKLRVTAYNCRARVEVAVVKWSDASGIPFTATLSRKVTKHQPLPGGATAIGVCGGWKREGTAGTVSATPSDLDVTYQLNMTASADGIATPFIDRIGVRYAPTFSGPAQAPVDLRLGVTRLTASLGMPPALAGNEATIELDKVVLAASCPGWEAVTKMWCPVQVVVKRFGSVNAVLHDGYIFNTGTTDGGVADRHLTLTLRDSMLRVSKTGDVNHAPIDHHYPPLDLIFAERVASGLFTSGAVVDGRIFGGDLIKEILRIAMGDDVADSINGDGNVSPGNYIPVNHPALLAPANDGGGWLTLSAILGDSVQGLTAPGFLFPPPFGDSALDWINSIAQQDRCIFYWGWPGGDMSARPVPIYGRYASILAHVTRETLPDAPYGDGVQRLITNLQDEQRGEKDVNDILVWSNADPGTAGILPAMRMAEARLPFGDPRAEELSWRRTLIVRQSIAFLPDAAEALANAYIAQVTGVNLQYPTLQVRGDERWRLGDIMTARANSATSDPSSTVNGVSFRIDRIDHEIVPEGGDEGFKTTLYPRALNTYEKANLPS